MKNRLSITSAILLLITGSSPSIGQERKGAFVTTDKTTSQLLAEGFEIKNGMFTGRGEAAFGFWLQKNATVYYCETSDRPRSSCRLLDEKH